MGCASPRNTRRSRRRSEVEIREDKDLGEEIAKPRKRRSKKENLSLVPCVLPSPTSSTSNSHLLSLFISISHKFFFNFLGFLCFMIALIVDDDDDGGRLDRIGQLMNDLIMWRDVARSTLWFGLGSLFFLSSCFAKGVNFR